MKGNKNQQIKNAKPIKNKRISKKIPIIIKKNLKIAPSPLKITLEAKASKYLLKSNPLP